MRAYAFLCLMTTPILGFSAHASSWTSKRVTEARLVRQVDARTFDFEIYPGMRVLNGGYRTELTHKTYFKNGDVISMRTRARIPKIAPGHPRSLVFAQWHESFGGLDLKGRPPFALRLRGNEVLMTAWNDEVLKSHGVSGAGSVVGQFPVRAGEWYEFEYQLKFHPTEGWMSGVVRSCENEKCLDAKPVAWIRHTGGLGYEAASHYYYKFGLYTTHPFTNSLKIRQSVPDEPVKVQ